MVRPFLSHQAKSPGPCRYAGLLIVLELLELFLRVVIAVTRQLALENTLAGTIVEELVLGFFASGCNEFSPRSDKRTSASQQWERKRPTSSPLTSFSTSDGTSRAGAPSPSPPLLASDLLAMVRLITHNLLACHAKSCISSPANFPLVFQDAAVEIHEAEFNPDFMRGFLPKIEWRALVSAARQVRSALKDWIYYNTDQRKR